MESKVTPETPVQGYKKSEYVTADQVLGQDVRIEEVPDGIKFFIKGQSVQLSEKRILVKLYELIKEDDGLKLRREFLENFPNRIPDEEEIALKYGPHDPERSEGYMWIAKWKGINNDDRGVMSEPIRISEKWRARFESHQRKVRGQVEASAAPAPAVVTSPAAGLGPLDVLRIIQEGEERAFRSMERMATIFKGNGAPEAVMVKAYEAAGSIMEKAMHSNFETMKKAGRVMTQSLEDQAAAAAGGVDDDDDLETQAAAAGESSAMPAWLAPFIPMIEPWIGKLLGGGPTGAALRTLVLSTEEWKEVFQDKDKFGQAVAAMEAHFGSDVTQKAMDVLLNRRADKSKKKGK